MCWPKDLRVWQISTFGAEDPAGLFHGILRRHWELEMDWLQGCNGCKVATVARLQRLQGLQLHSPLFFMSLASKFSKLRDDSLINGRVVQSWIGD